MLKNVHPWLKRILVAEIAILVMVLMVFGFKLALKSPKIKDFVVMATTKKPETFTELYFENSANLPKVISGRKLYTFTFTVHNLENRDAIYPYEVYLKRDNLKAIVDQGVVTIKNGDFSSIGVTMGPLSPFRKELVVELNGKNQTISFWMDK